MAKLFVIAGHGAGDPGACGNGYTEADLVRKLAKRIKELGGSDVKLGDFSRDYYADNGIMSLELPADTQIAELHMDSAAATARGGHVIIYDGYDADRYDEALADAIAGHFPGRAQKLVKRGDLANPWRAAQKGYGYRLVENGFITSADDVDAFISRIDDLAYAYLDAFGIKGAKKQETKPATKPKPSADVKDKVVTEGFRGGTYRVNADALNVRSKPSLSGSVVATYNRGETVVLDSWYTVADGYVWGRYTGASGNKRYVAVGLPTGEPEGDDYLVWAG